mmetsp:Transcript_47263/g.52837  ORF Transcript_47263/g.52837 Transcript_47263/m.52837 type:complete len:383 (-) Transcript_47263:243-1391(-)|eukprot:CAMPEP_0170794316 /NCGR_PEP_ID=MMETSP0733-20121128/23306_1 /TAXON_ID=186038 /ORGANISM="Fragilariopsis kerguelensis, Strain L26-C5" /LENGTH=382 /DNA_ID=CAMNT_0011143691 /DNA_START=137 /DNA_END=1285 /DNA_ORIENTATION=-
MVDKINKNPQRIETKKIRPDIEMQHLMVANTYDNDDSHLKERVCSTPKGGVDSLFQRLILLPLDERWNIKALLRSLGPRIAFIVRLMLVATFLDDSLHTVMHFSESSRQVAEAILSPQLVAAITLGIGLLAQSIGSIFLLVAPHLRPDAATAAVLGWAIAQPVLYAQLSNADFVAESLSLIGGLLLLRAHLLDDSTRAKTQLLGRLLLPSSYLYFAGHYLFSVLVTYDETTDLAMYIASLSKFVVTIGLLVGLGISAMLVAAGLKSRLVAFLLALVNLGIVCYLHPFFRFVRLGKDDDGAWKWKYDEDSLYNQYTMPIALQSDAAPGDFVIDPQVIYDLHRYYFFLGFSTSGALLLLAQFGPGKIAIQKNEVLLPVVARAQD